MHTEEKNEQNIRQQEAVHRLHECCTEENLWRCIAEFQNTRMWTASGLPFQYKLKVGRNGRFTKELWVDRREDSKSLAWSSVKLAFHSLYDAEAETSQENIECPAFLHPYSLLKFPCILQLLFSTKSHQRSCNNR